MPESVDSPAPERTTTSPPATRSASASRSWTSAGCPRAGAAVTGPSSPTTAGPAAGSGGEFLLQPLQHGQVHPAQPARGEGSLEEAADTARAVPDSAHAHG